VTEPNPPRKVGSDGWKLAWRVILIIAIVVDLLGALLAGFLASPAGAPQYRSAGIVFLVLSLLSLLAAILLLRQRAAMGWWWVLVAALFVPPVLIEAASENRLPIWWSQQLGGPMVTARITGGRLPPAVRTNWDLPPPQPLSTLGLDGVTVFIRPSFGFIDYDVDLAPSGLALPGRPTARLVVRPKSGPPREYRFRVPREDLQVTLGAFDARGGQWRGERGMAVDGTAILVERVKAGRATWIYTNSSPDSSPANPAAQLSTDLLALMLAYGPTGMIPRSYDWNVGRPDRGSKCLGVGLNTPAPEGVRLGNDDCARGEPRGR
jgi:hypothetical protein